MTQDKINYVKLKFIDNELGLSDAQKPIIFQRGALETSSFYRLGLGLSLVKRLVESYDGKIWVEDLIEGDYIESSKLILL